MTFLSQISSVLLSSLLAAGPLSAQLPSAFPAPENLQLQVVDGGGTTAAGSRSKGFTVRVTDASGVGVADAAVVLRLPDDGLTGTFDDGTHASVAYTGPTGMAQIAGFVWGSTAGTIAIKVTATRGTAHAGILVNEVLTAVPAASTPPPAASPALTPPSRSTSPPEPHETPNIPPPQPPASSPVTLPQPGAPDRALAHPVSPPLPTSAASTAEPVVSITNGDNHEHVHGSSGRKKWIILAVVIAAGAGAGIAMAGKSKSSPSTSTSSTVSIGTPTVTVGQP